MGSAHIPAIVLWMVAWLFTAGALSAGKRARREERMLQALEEQNALLGGGSAKTPAEGEQLPAFPPW
jgi:hypothetical protein